MKAKSTFIVAFDIEFMTFEDLEVSAPILSALKKEGYTHPTPIQEKSIPIVIKGGDLLACAQTGTGKTAAFSIPILQRLAATNLQGNKRKIRALIVTPTRELAIQIGESLTAYGAEDFKLRLWNRWGENFRTITKADVGRAQSDYLRQGDIAWDGYDRNPSASGTPQLVQNNTTYVFTLEMKYCGSTSFVQVQIGEENPCIRWDPIFHICINRISGWAGQINVIY